MANALAVPVGLVGTWLAMSDEDVRFLAGGHGKPCPYKTLLFGFAIDVN